MTSGFEVTSMILTSGQPRTAPGGGGGVSIMRPVPTHWIDGSFGLYLQSAGAGARPTTACITAYSIGVHSERVLIGDGWMATMPYEDMPHS